MTYFGSPGSDTFYSAQSKTHPTDVALTLAQVTARRAAVRSRVENLPRWDSLQELLEGSSLYSRMATRADTSPPVAFRATQLMVLIASTRNPARLQVILNRIAALPGFTAADKSELNDILQQAEFSERVS